MNSRNERKINFNKNLIPRHKKLEPKEIQLLWDDDYYDGPISGVCMVQGEKCYYRMFNFDEYVAFQDGRIDDFTSFKYVIIALTKEQLVEEEKWHQLFREKVGLHTDYNEFGERGSSKIRPPELRDEFYRRYKERAFPDYSKSPIIGWFEIKKVSELGWKKKTSE